MKYFAVADLKKCASYKLQYNAKNMTAQRLLSDFGTMAVSSEQERQCTYNVTLRYIRAIIVGVDKPWIDITY